MTDEIDVRVRMKETRRYNADAKSVARSTSNIGDAGDRAAVGTDRAAKSSSRARRGLVLLGAAAATGALALGGGLVIGAKAAIAAFQESQEVQAQTISALRSTGRAANVTAKHVGALAGRVSMKTGIDDEAIQAGENLLLTFTKIRNETGRGNKIFDQATVAATNLSVRFKKDLESSAILVGKALNDPVRGVTALNKVGVSFTQQQKDQIKAMAESGNVMGAQKAILRELSIQTKGAAVAQGKTLTGSINKLEVAAGNLGEMLIGKLAPHLTTAFQGAARFVGQMQAGKGAGGEFVVVLKRAGQGLLMIVGAGRSTVAVIVAIVEGFREGKTWALLLVLSLTALTAGILAYRTAMLVSAAATALMTGAQTALNLAMALNPVGLVIAGLVALGVAFIVAYRKVGWFRTGVNAVWSFVKKYWPLLLGILTGGIGPAVVYIIRNWDKIKGAASAVVGFVKARFMDYLNFWRGMPGRIAAVGKGIFNFLKDAFRSAINWVIDRWNGLQFRIPSIDLPGPGPKFGGATIGVPDIPHLAMGGAVSTGGAALVGDRDRELIRLPPGATVEPLTRDSSLRDLPGGRETVIPVHLHVDGREMAHTTVRHVDRDQRSK